MKFLSLMAVAAVAMLTVATSSAEARKFYSQSSRHQALDCDNNGRCSLQGVTRAQVKILTSRHRFKRYVERGVTLNQDRGAVSGNALVNEARKYIGTNPTGRRSLWCGAFMDLVLKRTGHPGGGNLASAYARYGTRISGPQIGAIAVMGRRGGGHVGVVSGIDANGNPIIISGNTRMGRGPHTTLEHAYPRSRIYAYVLPR